MTIIEQMNKISDHHHYAMVKLYQAINSEDDKADGCCSDYWRGVTKGLEAVMDMLGVEYEKFNPLN